MAEYLGLREDCLARTTRLDLAIIEARMLWPHKPDTRNRYVSAVSIKLAAEGMDRVPFPKPTPTEVRELAEAMLSAPHVEDFTEAGKRAYAHGLVAGDILFEAVGNRDAGRETALGDIKSALAARLGPAQRLSRRPSTMRCGPATGPWRTFGRRTFIDRKKPIAPRFHAGRATSLFSLPLPKSTGAAARRSGRPPSRRRRYCAPAPR